MAPMGSIKLVGAATDNTSQPNQQPSSSQVSQPKEDVTESLEKDNQQHSSRAEERALEADAMDDDVQLVLSVPRRRKKKRKRFEIFDLFSFLAHSNRFIFPDSPLGQYQETKAIPNEALNEESKVVDGLVRRKSTSVVQRLESCHIGEKDTGVRRGSLPAVPISMTAPIQLSWTHNPNYASNQFSSFAVQAPWWDEPTTPLPHVSLPASNWGLWQQEDNDMKKRKYEDGWQDDTPRKQYRQSTQISPRSNPLSVPNTSRLISQPQPNSGMSHAYERQISDHSTNMTWPSFDWEPYRIINPQYVSPYSASPIPMDLTDANNGNVAPSFQDWSQHTNMFTHDFDPNQGDCGMYSPSQSPVQQPAAPPARYSMSRRNSPGSPLQQSIPVSGTQQLASPSVPDSTTLVSNVGVHQPATFGNGSGRAASSTPVPSQPRVQTSDSPSDILRRPSLYKIPAWPPSPSPSSHSSPSPSPGIPPAIIHSISITPDLGRRKTLLNTSAAAPSTAQQLPHVAQKPNSTLNAGTILRVNGSVSPSSPTSRDQSPTKTVASTEGFQIPRARAGRKHSPNM